MAGDSFSLWALTHPVAGSIAAVPMAGCCGGRLSGALLRAKTFSCSGSSIRGISTDCWSTGLSMDVALRERIGLTGRDGRGDLVSNMRSTGCPTSGLLLYARLFEVHVLRTTDGQE